MIHPMGSQYCLSIGKDLPPTRKREREWDQWEVDPAFQGPSDKEIESLAKQSLSRFKNVQPTALCRKEPGIESPSKPSKNKRKRRKKRAQTQSANKLPNPKNFTPAEQRVLKLMKHESRLVRSLVKVSTNIHHQEWNSVSDIGSKDGTISTEENDFIYCLFKEAIKEDDAQFFKYIKPKVLKDLTFDGVKLIDSLAPHKNPFVHAFFENKIKQ